MISERLGTSDYGNIYLKRIGDRIQLKRFDPLDAEFMDDYMSDRVDIRGEWQNAVYNWDTDLGYDEYRDNYEYDYGDYFYYDNEEWEWYDEDEDWMTWDYFNVGEHEKDYVIERVLERFDSQYIDWNFEWEPWMNENRIRELVSEAYDECKERIKQQEEARKPHWNVFNYYK